MTNNTNANVKLRMNSKGQLAEAEKVTFEYRRWTASELCKARTIRAGCAYTVEMILDGYNPLQGLPELEAPKKKDPVELIRFAQFAATEELTVDETVKIIAESEKQYNEHLSSYKRELRNRRYIIEHYESVYSYILDSILAGSYREALRKVRSELKGSYRAEVSSAIIRALSQEAPLAKSASERCIKILEMRDAKKKIKEGVKTLLKI